MNHFTSQCGEDEWLAANWQKLGLPERGFFVEFGAADGVSTSNTYWLEKAKGWRGLLCEADPRNYLKLIECGRGSSILEQVAIGPAGVASFGLDTNDPCLSGILRDSTERIEIASVPLSDVLNRLDINRVDLISIDTEGTELEAWRTLDLTRWRPRVAIIEYNSWGISNDLAPVKAQLEADGYELLKTTRYNAIFRSVA